MKNAYYDNEVKAVITEFSGSPSLAQFKAVAETVLVQLEKHKATKALNNTLELKMNSIENQEWTQSVWFPRAIELGLKHFAFVVPSDIFGKVSTELTNEKAETENIIEIKYFETEKEAKLWLKDK